MSFLKNLEVHILAVWNWLKKSGIAVDAEKELFALANNFLKNLYPGLPVPTVEQELALVTQLGKIHTASEFFVTMEKFAELVREGQKK
jgi:hypothetical protein